MAILWCVVRSLWGLACRCVLDQSPRRDSGSKTERACAVTSSRTKVLSWGPEHRSEAGSAGRALGQARSRCRGRALPGISRPSAESGRARPGVLVHGMIRAGKKAMRKVLIVVWLR